MKRRAALIVLAIGLGGLTVAANPPAAKNSPNATPRPAKPAAGTVPDPQQPGGETQGIVQIANLVYAGTKTSKCFSDHFLIKAEKESTISTSRRFHAVKLGSDELFSFPLIIMTGEGEFTLPDQERENLRRFVERGGMLLASAGCSSADWDRSFRREMALVFPANPLEPLAMEHPVFHTVFARGCVGVVSGRQVITPQTHESRGKATACVLCFRCSEQTRVSAPWPFADGLVLE